VDPRTRESAWMGESGRGNRIVKHWSKGNAQFCEHEGILIPIDETAWRTTTKPVGAISLKEKMPVSLGIRRDNNPFKYIGLRPDFHQDGKQQLEFTIEDININGTSKPIDLSKNIQLTPHIFDLGNVLVRKTKRSTQQMVRPDEEVKDYSIRYTVHAKGLIVENEKKNDVYVIRDNRKPLIIQDLGINANEEYTAFLGTNPQEFTAIMARWKDNTVMRTQLAGGIGDFIKMDLPPEYDVLHAGSPICYSYPADKGLFFALLNCPYDREITRGLLIDAISSLTNKSVEFVESDSVQDTVNACNGLPADSKSATAYVGEIIMVDGKWVGNVVYDLLAKYVECSIWTKVTQNPDLYHDAQGVDCFSHASEFGIDYESFVTAVTEHITTPLQSTTKVEVSGEYYVPNDRNEFVINDEAGHFRFKITPPKLLDKNFKVIALGTKHTLKPNPDGTMEYIKYPGRALVNSALLRSARYIDADIIDADSSDNSIYGIDSANDVNSPWNSVRSTTVNHVLSSVSAALYDARGANSYKGGTVWDAWISRIGMWFDTSGYKTDAELESATLTLYCEVVGRSGDVIIGGPISLSPPMVLSEAWWDALLAAPQLDSLGIGTTGSKVWTLPIGTPAWFDPDGDSSLTVLTYEDKANAPVRPALLDTAPQPDFYFSSAESTSFDGPYLTLEIVPLVKPSVMSIF